MTDDNFIITRTQVMGDKTTVFYTEYGLNINGSIDMTNDDFQKAVSNDGYHGVGLYILNLLYDEIGSYLNDKNKKDGEVDE